MISRVQTVSILGLQPTGITVEIDTIQGIPQLQIIGLPTKAIEEAKERIVAAFAHIGVEPRRKRTIVNLTPADLPKTSAGVELAIAVGLLEQYGYLPRPHNPAKKIAYIGELSLDGSILPVKGLLPLALAAQQLGITDLIFPHSQSNLLNQVIGMKLYPLKHLKQLRQLESLAHNLTTLQVPSSPTTVSYRASVDFKDIAGQEIAKRALTIAAAGGHHILMTGPPGAGKSLLAQALIGILPPLTATEQLEVTTLHSLVATNPGIVQQRPFRQPHHALSFVGLVGGTSKLLPGEISLAHRGVLFLDEIAEFPRQHLEALRQPLSQGSITLKKSTGNVEYPARFTLVAATNPCPCGYDPGSQHSEITSPTKICRCTPHLKQTYQQKISGPIQDRIDLHVFVSAVPFNQITKHSPVNTARIRERVIAARAVQRLRQDTICNAEISHQTILLNLKQKPNLRNALESIHTKLGLTMRSTMSLMRVAQTIADLDQSDISIHHLLEAAQYRQV